jgi:DNA replication protein DnaC
VNESLRSALKQLRLYGLLDGLEVRLHEAAGNRLNHAEFLEMILHDELAVRADRQLQRRVKAAQLRELKTLEDFDWSFNRRSKGSRSATWRRAASCARPATCCSWDRRE